MNESTQVFECFHLLQFSALAYYRDLLFLWCYGHYLRLFMVALWNRAGHYILPGGFFRLSSIFFLFLPRLISAAAGWMSTIL